MTIFARSLPSPAHPRQAALRCMIYAAGVMAALSSALLLTPAPAGAIVSHIGAVPVGQQPRVQTQYLLMGMPTTGLEEEEVPDEPRLERSTYANAEGNPVVHSSNTWAIYWDPYDYYHGDWQSLIDGYFAHAAAASGSTTSVFSVDSQYTDKSNQPAAYQQTFRGAAVDTHPYPSSEGCVDPNPPPRLQRIRIDNVPTIVCLTSTQVEHEVERYVQQQKLPTGMGNIFYVMTPPGVAVCLDGGGPDGHCSDYEATEKSYDNSLCSYHADINPGNPAAGSASTILYGVIPWSAGTYADPDFDPQVGGWECQDGGYNPAEHEKLEATRVKDEAEEEAFAAKNDKEKEEQLRAETLEGPHEQEPNQQKCPTSDGGCDYGLADLIINQISVEQQNIVTDPLLNGWQDKDHLENTDECRFFFAPVFEEGSATANPETFAGTLNNQILDGGKYYLNDAFNYAAELLTYPGVPCLNGISVEPKFTSPSPVNSEELVDFNGMESDISLDAATAFTAGGSPKKNYATYTWNFGDGTPTVSGYAPGSAPCEEPWLSPCAASVGHSYEYGGTYKVTLTVKDVGGYTASVTHEITVVGPPPPSETPPSESAAPSAPAPSSTPSSTPSTTPSGSSSSSLAPAGVPAPIAAAVILPQSLRKAMRKGLVVSYSVNEQVAGHFDVLLSRSLARRLGISGAPATGLPAGSPPELVIATAVLVTTKGGRSTLHIHFPKRTAARLAHAHNVPLMLRLIVRNAATSNPATTTVITSATLNG